MNQEIDVSPFFMCPISLQLMKDPVTVSTGITYDRENIEKWLFSSNNNNNKTCPVTKQQLSHDNQNNDLIILTPNHTLRRLIQAWCTINSSHGIQRIPTPKPPTTINLIQKIIKEASDSLDSPHLLIQSLKRLKSIASESETNRRCIESAGAVEFLAEIITKNTNSSASSSSTEFEDTLYDDFEGFAFEFKVEAEDEAISILHNLHLSEQGLKTLLNFKNGEFLDSLIKLLQKGIYDSRTYAVLLLKSISEVAEPAKLSNLKTEFFVELVQLLKDQISKKASKATLQTLIQVVEHGRNRVRLVESGCVCVLIELLLDCKERKPCEMILVVLEMLCQCADGRAEILKHGCGLGIVSKKILRVSNMANDRAVRILLSVSRFSATPLVVQEMLEIGIVAKLCLILQVDSGNKAKDKAREILKLHAKSWRHSHCIPTNLLASYPTQ
ncbi:E3 ubiquitin-protein ligase PUB23-like [Cicer arietinum]|uniref:U-box domain-containing protein n=1 Tax=Cicer arietinum TaxID=3827 RepID=A0A1S2Y2B5_CICAR|nr:E3 ubiquitin-protein ligase PUB23-like [Cicer arietinum]